MYPFYCQIPIQWFLYQKHIVGLVKRFLENIPLQFVKIVSIQARYKT